MPVPPLAHAGHWFVGLIYLAPVAILVLTLLVIGRRDRRAEAAEVRDQETCGHTPDPHGGRPA